MPRLDLGGVGSGDEYAFFQVRGAVRLSTGQIVVADASSRELKFFGPEGAYQFSTGRRGEGPGEFLWIDSLVVRAGDTLAVMEHRRRLLSEFDREGTFQRSRRLNAPRFIWFLGILTNGTAIAQTASTIVVDPAAPVLEQDSFSILRFNRSGTKATVIDVLPKSVSYSRTFGSCHIGVGNPLGGQVRMAVAGDRIATGRTRSSAIRITDREGRTHVTIKTGLTPRRTTAAVLAKLRGRYSAMVDDQGPGRCNYGRRALQILDDIPAPESLPLFDRLMFDDQGNLWVEEFGVGEATATWRVFDSQGNQMARASVPGNVKITQIGSDFILGIVFDDMGLERVQLYRLHRRSNTSGITLR